jgi:hypothetical protein
MALVATCGLLLLGLAALPIMLVVAYLSTRLGPPQVRVGSNLEVAQLKTVSSPPGEPGGLGLIGVVRD